MQKTEIYCMKLPEQIEQNEIRTLLSVIDEDKKARVMKKSQRKDAYATLYGDLMVRMIASKILHQKPMEVRFQYNEWKKPSLKISNGVFDEFQFNLSHSEEYVVVAYGLGIGEIGCDIQKFSTKSQEQHVEMAKIVFDEQEIAKIRTSEDFFWLWSRKESFLKAVGMGFALNPKSQEVLTDEITYKGQKFFFHEYCNMDSYAIVACTMSRERPVFHLITPDQLLQTIRNQSI